MLKTFQSVSGTMEVDWALNVPQATGAQSFGPYFGVETYDDPGSGTPLLIGSAGIDAKTGEVLYQEATTGYLDSTGITVSFNQFHTFKMLLDFDTQQYQVYVDGTLVETQGFVDSSPANPITSFTDADLSALAAEGDPLSQAATGSAYFDDYVVSLPAQPELSSITVGDGTAQRSEVRQLTLNFSKPVTLGSGALTLDQLNSGGSGANDGSAPSDATSALGQPTTSDGGMTWVVPIVANTPFSDATGSLKDGIYSVTVHGAQVTDSANQHMGGDQSLTFHRLFGDIDGNKTINNLDYLNFKKSYGSTRNDPVTGSEYNPNFDYDANGTINNLDYLHFKANYGKTFQY